MVDACEGVGFIVIVTISVVVWPSMSVALGTWHIVYDRTVQHVCELVVVVVECAVSAELLEGWVVIDPPDVNVELFEV